MDRSHLGLSERIDGRLRVCEQCLEEALFLHIKGGRDRDGAEVGLAALQLARDDELACLLVGYVVCSAAVVEERASAEAQPHL